MKRSILLVLCATLLFAALPALAEESAPPEPEVAAPVADLTAEDAAMSPATLPSDLFAPEPELAACTHFQCRQECRAGCSPGCRCFGFCSEGFCECTEVCF